MHSFAFSPDLFLPDLNFLKANSRVLPEKHFASLFPHSDLSDPPAPVLNATRDPFRSQSWKSLPSQPPTQAGPMYFGGAPFLLRKSIRFPCFSASYLLFFLPPFLEPESYLLKGNL